MRIHVRGEQHLTATNRRHIAAILANGWQSGTSGRIRYSLAPLAGETDAYAVTIRKNESDDWGRPVERLQRVTIEARP